MKVVPMSAGEIAELLETGRVQVVMADERLNELWPLRQEITEHGEYWVVWGHPDANSLGRLYPPHTPGERYAVGEELHDVEIFAAYRADGKLVEFAGELVLWSSLDSNVPAWQEGSFPAGSMPLKYARHFVRCESVDVETVTATVADLEEHGVSIRPLSDNPDVHRWLDTFILEKP